MMVVFCHEDKPKEDGQWLLNVFVVKAIKCMEVNGYR